jgi:hypothetical protein
MGQRPLERLFHFQIHILPGGRRFSRHCQQF